MSILHASGLTGRGVRCILGAAEKLTLRAIVPTVRSARGAIVTAMFGAEVPEEAAKARDMMKWL